MLFSVTSRIYYQDSEGVFSLDSDGLKANQSIGNWINSVSKKGILIEFLLRHVIVKGRLVRLWI